MSEEKVGRNILNESKPGVERKKKKGNHFLIAFKFL